jgi:Lysine methyltransferase
MTIYMEPPTLLEFDPQCSICHRGKGAVLELGAGNGFLGLKMARILSSKQEEHEHTPKTLVLTDLDAVCPLLERNCLNGFPTTADLPLVNLVVQPLEWGNLDHGWRLADKLISRDSSGGSDPSDALLSHIVCSDLVSMCHAPSYQPPEFPLSRCIFLNCFLLYFAHCYNCHPLHFQLLDVPWRLSSRVRQPFE